MIDELYHRRIVKEFRSSVHRGMAAILLTCVLFIHETEPMRDFSLSTCCSIAACAVLFASRVFAATPEQHVKFDDPNAFDVRGRTLAIENGAVYLDAAEGEGVAWLRSVQFVNGRISIEVQGADRMGKSFVGFAFHASPDRKRSDVVYVRPFNFQATDPQRRAHALQYIAMPDHGWELLRVQFPGKYEAAITPAPKPEDWVRVIIEVDDGKARVFIDDHSSPALTVDLLNTSGGDALGLWVGNNSDGRFRNLHVERAD
jgi:hypothetical protein